MPTTKPKNTKSKNTKTKNISFSTSTNELLNKQINSMSYDDLEKMLISLENELHSRKRESVHISILMDASGSMAPLRSDVIGGLNNFLDSQKNEKGGQIFVSCYSFNNPVGNSPAGPVWSSNSGWKFKTTTRFIINNEGQSPSKKTCDELFADVKIENVKKINQEVYNPSGSTALYDAMGELLSSLLEKNNKNNLIVIFTDGEENSSRLYTQNSVQALTKRCEEKGWKFIYLGANQDSFGVSRSLGITKGFVQNYAPSAAGLQNAYEYTTTSTSAYLRSVFNKNE